jgi:4-aminobutyrate aminotransferase-like enzyme
MGNVLTLTPPLTISEQEMLRAVDIVSAAIQDAQAKRRGGTA